MIDYNGPNGNYGYVAGPEILEIPRSVKKLLIDLEDTVVLYHGTQAEWNKIARGDHSAPQKIFYSAGGIVLDRTSLELPEGRPEPPAMRTVWRESRSG